MLTFLCPNCWAEVQEDEKICPKCHSEIEALRRGSYLDGLVRALRHPWASNRMWSVFILGEMRDKQAIKPLIDIMDKVWDTKDLWFLREVAIALGKIDGDEAVSALAHLLDHHSFLIREAALKALAKVKNKEAWKAVKKALDDPNPGVRALAKEILE